MPTHVKICGITRLEDAFAAYELGADALGLNFLRGPRRIDPEVARQIQYAVPPEDAQRTLHYVGLCSLSRTEYPDSAEWTSLSGPLFYALQIYARNYQQLTSASNLNLQWWIVRHVADRDSLRAILSEVRQLAHPPAALLLDTASEKSLGGTGLSFNWNWIADARAAGELDDLPPIILAGGLTPDNVADAIRIAQPSAVDVSSGVEVPGKPGIKDPARMRDFIQAAKAAR